MTTRRNFMALAGAAGLSTGLGGSAHAQSTVDGWPSRAVRVISPTATGGPSQNFRLYADNLKNTFGQSFVLESMPGGSGSIGCMAVARSAADGHTILLASNSFIVLAPLVISGNPVNVKRDFDPIALLFTFPFLLVVNPELGVTTLKDFVDLRQGATGGAQLGLAGHRHRRTSGDGGAAQANRHPGPARALCRHDAAAARNRGRHPAVHVRHAGQFQGHPRRRQGDRARRHRRQALEHRPRGADLQGTGLRRLRRSARFQRVAGAQGHVAKIDQGVYPPRS